MRTLEEYLSKFDISELEAIIDAKIDKSKTPSIHIMLPKATLMDVRLLANRYTDEGWTVHFDYYAVRNNDYIVTGYDFLLEVP